MKFHAIIFTLLAAAGLSSTVEASTRATSCDGCTYNQKKAAARNAIGSGIVYVFNAEATSVDKFRVYYDSLGDSVGRQSTKVVQRLDAETNIKTKYRQYIHAFDDFAELNNEITLPSLFPVKSVAGVHLDESFATSALESHLMNMNGFAEANLGLSAVIGLLLQKNIPVFDMGHIMKSVSITFIFPDGSRMDFNIAFSLNAGTGESRPELTPNGNAYMADGQPFPSHAVNVRDLRFDNTGGALFEWSHWVQELGIRLVNRHTGGNQPYMICSVDKGVLRCVLYNSP